MWWLIYQQSTHVCVGCQRVLLGAADGVGAAVGGDHLSRFLPDVAGAVRHIACVLTFARSDHRYMAPPWAVLVSAAVFTGAHAWRSPTLFLLGVVLGCLYAWSRNLAHPLCLHALWNLWLFCRSVG